MLPRSRRVLQVVAAVILLTSVTIGFSVWQSRRPTVRLAEARLEAAALLVASNLRERERHADLCVEFSRPILNEPDRIGITAALFTIGVAPITQHDTSDVKLPDARQVELVQTEDLILISRLFFHTQRFGPSDQLLDLILSRKDGDRIAALRLASMVRFELGRDDDVLNHCDELIRLSSTDAKAFRVKAMVHRNHGKWDHFVDAAEKAFELDGRRDRVLQVELIDGYVHLGQTQDARRELDVVIASRPDLVEQIPLLVCRLLIQEGKTEDASALNSKYLTAAPDDVEALILHGQLLIAKGRFDDAIIALQHAIDLSPAEELAWFQIGQAYARSGNNELAQASLQKHRSILDTKVQLNSLESLAAREPSNIIVRSELARLYAELGMTGLSDFWIRAAQAASGKEQ